MGLSENGETNSDQQDYCSTTGNTAMLQQQEEKSNINNNSCNYSIEYESDDDESAGPFVPYIEIKRMEGCLLINAVALKEVALTSALFQVLEEEKLDIVFESQHRTHSKVSHTIQVRVQPGYNTDVLARKLSIWAGKRM